MKVCTQHATSNDRNCRQLWQSFFLFLFSSTKLINYIKYKISLLYYSQSVSVDVIHNNPVILPVWLLVVISWDNAHTHHHNNPHQHLLSSMFSDGEIQSRKQNWDKLLWKSKFVDHKVKIFAFLLKGVEIDL